MGTDPPIIDKVDLNAMPVMQIAVSGQRPMQEITEIARKQIKEDLESVSGVGAVILVGGRQRAVNIYIDTDKLTSCNLSIEDVRQALVRQNLELPGGRVDQGSRELVLRTMGRVETHGRVPGPDRGQPERLPGADQGPRPRGGLVRGAAQPGPAGRPQRRQPDRAEAVRGEHGRGGGDGSGSGSSS